MSPILPLFAAVLATLPYVHGYGRGAPDTTCGVASSMLPGHGSQRQPSSTNPYALSTANGQSTYTAGDVITLTLNGGATPFSGFLVQAISVNGGIVGTMIAPPGSKVLPCGGKGDHGLTHSTKTPKSSFAFQWKAPDPVIAGDITFLVTVVQRYSTYWVNEPMLTIRPVQNAQPRILPQAQTPVTVSTQGPTPLRAKLQTPNGQIQYNMECGVSKGCFVDCSSNTDCAYMVTWKDLGSAVQFEVYGKQDPSFTEAWVAVGFSSDLHMGDDSVTECVSSNGLIKAFNSHNPDAYNMRLTDPPLGLSNVAGYYSNGVFACTFTREKNVPQDPKIFDLEKDWHLMYANGKSSRAWQLDIHSLTNRPPVTSAKMDFQARVVTGNAPQAPGTPQAQTTLVSSIDTTTLTSQPPTQGGKIQYDPECGSTKGCFVDCKGGDCKYMVTWKDLGSSVQFELYGKPDRSFTDAWVAVGFSDDTRMGGDSVTECVYSNGVVQAFSSYNTGYSNRRLDNPQFGLSNVAGIYYDGVLSCTFIRRKFVPQDPKMYNLEDDWHIMFANGRVLQVPAWELYMHSITELPPTSAARVDFQSTVVIGSGAKFPLVKAHGCLMILAWVLFTGVGIVAARYYKNVWADKTFLKLKIWFQVHRACMVSALVFDVVAFIIIFIEVQGYSSIPDVPGKGYLRSHPILGIIITILCIANPVMALFRPGPDHDKRPIFNWAHWGVGMSAYILSAICICFGFQLGKSSTPDYAIYIMIVYVLYIIIFDVVFEVMEFMSKKQKKVKVDGMEMSSTNGTDNGNIPNGNHVTKETIRKTDKVKTMLLAIHIAFTGAFALVLVLVVALN